jgi:YggT family protein
MIALISLVLSLFTLVLFARGILSWIPNKTGALATADSIAFTITEPVLAPVRKVIPPLGGLDVSFFVVFIGIYLIRIVLL